MEPEPHQNVYPEPESHKFDTAPQHWLLELTDENTEGRKSRDNVTLN
jgi:hypothetical protein